MVAQVRGCREDGRTSATAAGATTTKEPNVCPRSRTTTAAASKLKLERRNGSQSLCSSSSELQDSSSASPSSSSTLSLASSTLATVYKQQPSNNNTNNRKNYHQQQPSQRLQQKQFGGANHSTPVAASSPQSRKPQQQQRRQPVSWNPASTLLERARSSRASLSASSSSNSNASYSSCSADSSRSNSGKLAAPSITNSSTNFQRRSTSVSSGAISSAAPATSLRKQPQRSSDNQRAAATVSCWPQDRSTSHVRLHYGSLSSLASANSQRRPSQPSARRLCETHSSLSADTRDLRHQSRLSSASSPLLERSDVRRRGQQPTGALIGRPTAAEQFSWRRQPQVRWQTQRRSYSVQQLHRGSTQTLTATTDSSCLSKATSSNLKRQVQPASSATTNSRLRQAAIYARRHSHTTTRAPEPTKSAPTPTLPPAAKRVTLSRASTTPATTSRCPLVTGGASLMRDISGQQKNHAPASHASPRISSLHVAIRSSSISSSVSSSRTRERTLQRQTIGAESEGISRCYLESSRLVNVATTTTTSKQRAGANSRDARDRQLLVAVAHRRKPPVALSTKPTWRSSKAAASAAASEPRSKMTSALAVSIGALARYHQPTGIVVAVKSGERSDGRSSGDSSSGDASSESSDENVQPAPLSPVTRNHLLARASKSSSSSSSSGCTDSLANDNSPNLSAVAGRENNNNRESDDVGSQQQQQRQLHIRENFIRGANKPAGKIYEETTTVGDRHLSGMVAAAAITTTIPALAVVETAAPKTPATTTAEHLSYADRQTSKALNESSVGILMPRDISPNIINNNNNNINQTQLVAGEENLIKRPLSDIEPIDCGENLKQGANRNLEMTNVKIKIQRKLSVAPDVPIKTEPICLYYDLEARPFARGKFAQVKRCISKSSQQCFAAKCIKKRRRLVDIRHEIILEIEALKLSYFTDHIVKLYEVFETPTEMILILEMANGGELQRVIDDEEAIDEKLVKQMIRQILEGLVQLHDNDIAHLDIKPQNLLLTEPFPKGDVKLCDFGMSRRLSKHCEIREICGTPDYVAPEILRYDPISLATDMWSLGILTYVLLTGYSPFGSENRQQTFCNITQATLDFPSEIFYKISEDAVDFMQKLIVREPSERLTSHQARNHPWLCQ